MLFENTIGSCPGFVPGTPKKMDLVVTCRYDSSVFLFVKEDRSYIRNNNHRFLSVNPITSVNFSIHQEPPKHWQSCGHECSIPLDSQNYAVCRNLECVGNLEGFKINKVYIFSEIMGSCSLVVEV